MFMKNAFAISCLVSSSVLAGNVPQGLLGGDRLSCKGEAIENIFFSEQNEEGKRVLKSQEFARYPITLTGNQNDTITLTLSTLIGDSSHVLTPQYIVPNKRGNRLTVYLSQPSTAEDNTLETFEILVNPADDSAKEPLDFKFSRSKFIGKRGVYQLEKTIEATLNCTLQN